MKLLTVARTAIALSSLSLLIAFAGLFISSGSKAESTEHWHPLSEIVSTQQLTQIVADNTAPGANRAEIARSAIGLSRGDLLIVDFETSSLCGRGGCAVAGYRISTGEQILFTYALQPASASIIEFVDRDAELPCLRIAPPINKPAQGLTKDTLCYRDAAWITEAL